MYCRAASRHKFTDYGHSGSLGGNPTPPFGPPTLRTSERTPASAVESRPPVALIRKGSEAVAGSLHKSRDVDPRTVLPGAPKYKRLWPVSQNEWSAKAMFFGYFGGPGRPRTILHPPFRAFWWYLFDGT